MSGSIYRSADLLEFQISNDNVFPHCSFGYEFSICVFCHKMSICDIDMFVEFVCWSFCQKAELHAFHIFENFSFLFFDTTSIMLFAHSDNNCEFVIPQLL